MVLNLHKVNLITNKYSIYEILTITSVITVCKSMLMLFTIYTLMTHLVIII